MNLTPFLLKFPEYYLEQLVDGILEIVLTEIPLHKKQLEIWALIHSTEIAVQIDKDIINEISSSNS